MRNDEEVCQRCGGDGYDPDQSNPTYEQLVNNDPRTCQDCDGHGKIFPYDFDDDF